MIYTSEPSYRRLNRWHRKFCLLPRRISCDQKAWLQWVWRMSRDQDSCPPWMYRTEPEMVAARLAGDAEKPSMEYRRKFHPENVIK